MRGRQGHIHLLNIQLSRNWVCLFFNSQELTWAVKSIWNQHQKYAMQAVVLFLLGQQERWRNWCLSLTMPSTLCSPCLLTLGWVCDFLWPLNFVYIWHKQRIKCFVITACLLEYSYHHVSNSVCALRGPMWRKTQLPSHEPQLTNRHVSETTFYHPASQALDADSHTSDSREDQQTYHQLMSAQTAELQTNEWLLCEQTHRKNNRVEQRWVTWIN